MSSETVRKAEVQEAEEDEKDEDDDEVQGEAQQPPTTPAPPRGAFAPPTRII